MSIIGNPILLGGEDIDLSFITAGANDILSPKVGVDTDGNPITGTIPTQAGATITPSSTSQTVVTAGKYVTGNIVVAGIPLAAGNSF